MSGNSLTYIMWSLQHEIKKTKWVIMMPHLKCFKSALFDKDNKQQEIFALKSTSALSLSLDYLRLAGVTCTAVAFGFSK